MYKIIIKSSGKYHNARVGERYCITKKSAINLIQTFLDCECDIEVEKFVRLHGDIFCWTDDDEGDKVFDYYYDRLTDEDDVE